MGMKFWNGMTVKPVLVGADTILIGDSEDIETPLKYSTMTALITALSGGVVIDIVGKLPVTSWSDLNRVNLADGNYNVDGSISGSLLVINSFYLGVWDSVLQIYTDSIQILIRRIDSSGLPAFPAWLTVSVSADDRVNWNGKLDRVITPTKTGSSSVVTLNCNNYTQDDTNTGGTDVTLAFSNLPSAGGENSLIIRNGRATAFNLVLPTANITSGGITYAFKSIVASPLVCAIGGSVELSLWFVFIDSTHCEIRITGGATV